MTIEAGVRETASRVAAALSPQAAQIRERYEAKLRSARFRGAERQALLNFTPLSSPDTWEESARALALMNLGADRLQAALERFFAAAPGAPGSDVLAVRLALVAVFQRCQAEIAEADWRALLDWEETRSVRLSHALHDEPAQSLALIRLHLEMLDPAGQNQARMSESISEMKQAADRTIFAVRNVIADLSPEILRQKGLAAALRHLANRARSHSEVRIITEAGDIPTLPERVAVALYRVVQETISSAQAGGNVKKIRISVSCPGQKIRLSVQHDGGIFEGGEASRPPGCNMLGALRARIRLLGGSVSLKTTGKSQVPSDKRPRYTHLTLTIPLTGETPGSMKL